MRLPKSLVSRSLLNAKENITNGLHDYWGLIQCAMLVYAEKGIVDKRLKEKDNLWREMCRVGLKDEIVFERSRKIASEDTELITQYLTSLKDVEDVVDISKAEIWKQAGIIGSLAFDFDD